MNITVSSRAWDAKSQSVLVIFAAKTSAGKLSLLPEAGIEAKTLSTQLESNGFAGEANEVLGLFHLDGWVVVVGLGERKNVTLDSLRQAAGTAARLLRTHPAGSLRIPAISVSGIGPSEAAQAVVEGALLAVYRYEEYKQPRERDKTRLTSIEIAVENAGARKSVQKGVDRAKVIAESVYLTRDLINGPSNLVTPTYLAKQAQALNKIPYVKVQVMGFAELKKNGFGGIVAVSQGSDHPAQFIVIDYKPAGAKSTIALCGKGVTFDTGGISLKPSSKMELMKYDMSGAAAVLGTLKAVSELKMPQRVIGIIAATENMPSGTAQKPGDILKTLSGKTVEVLNTDAEGRLVLADCLHYAKRFNPDAVIDLATLTGACVVALGSEAIGLMSTDDRLAKRIIDSGEATQERLWRLPLWEPYGQLMESDIADLKNVSNTGEAGTITAGKFLESFTEGLKWAHLDIASTAWTQSDKPYKPKGAVGIGVRLLVDLIDNWKK